MKSGGRCDHHRWRSCPLYSVHPTPRECSPASEILQPTPGGLRLICRPAHTERSIYASIPNTKTRRSRLPKFVSLASLTYVHLYLPKTVISWSFLGTDAPLQLLESDDRQLFHSILHPINLLVKPLQSHEAWSAEARIILDIGYLTLAFL